MISIKTDLPSKFHPPVALVTGAAGIIGPSICRVLREAGWCVVASDLAPEIFSRYEAAHGHSVSADAFVSADLNTESNCRRLVAETEAVAGPLSLVVHCATAHGRHCSFEQSDSEFCHRLLNVDLLAPLFLSQAAAQSLAKNRGSIILLSSVHVAVPIPVPPFYRVVKAAVEKLAETLAAELGPKGIRANAIRVGWIPGTAFLRSSLEKLPSFEAKQLHDEILPAYLAEKRAQGGGSAEDIAHLAAFLASPQGASIQGVTIPADSGLPLKMRPHPGSVSESAFSEWFTDPEAALHRWLEKKKLYAEA